MLKKMISMFVVFSIIISAVPAYAASINAQSPNTTSVSEMDIQYSVENGHPTVTVGDTKVYRIGNEIFTGDGVKIATVETSTTSAPRVERRTGWMYGDGNCPTGYTPGDYNELYSTKSHNISLEKTIAECTRDILVGIVVLAFPFGNPVTGAAVFKLVIDSIYDNFKKYANNDHLYAMEYIYSGGMPFTHKNIFNFYADKAMTDYIETATCYSWWG